MFDKNRASEKALATESGMWMLWDYAQYQSIHTYEEWDALFCEDADLKKQIALAKAVPVNIGADGAFQFRVKVDTPLDERERSYVHIQSEPYLLKSDGAVVLSGVEYISGDVQEPECIQLDLHAGSYSVVVYLIDWEREPGMVLRDGSPAPDALPDFIICLQSLFRDSGTYRKALETFGD